MASKILLLLLAVIVLIGCDSQSQSVSVDSVPIARISPEESIDSQIESFCGACHGVPRPENFPKDRWAEEIEQGYRLFFKSGRTDLRPVQPSSRVHEYYRQYAPERLTITQTPPFSSHDRSSGEPTSQESTEDTAWFLRRDFPILVEDEPLSISHICWLGDPSQQPSSAPDFESITPATKVSHEPALLACDMKRGHLVRVSLEDGTPSQTEFMGRFRNLAFAEPVDLDQDGRVDYLIADLGSFVPGDHSKGRVYWLHRDAGDQWEKTILLHRVGRVASLETGDFDADGQIDILVAEFGWRETGNLHWLRNTTTDAGEPRFDAEIIDERSGAIQIQKCDLNADGQLDFVTVLTQEHELVLAYLNDGRGHFTPQTIFAADYPSYGSSGIEQVDFDGDGDLDILMTNGDAFDDYMLKPYFSIQWLENRGTYPYTHHHIADMQGVYRALPGDFDGDGDMDVIATALLPKRIDNPTDFPLHSILLLEQDGVQFHRHVLETANSNHATLEVADFNGDGRPDFATGEFWPDSKERTLSVWINRMQGYRTTQ
ncbi:FG-GAP repeat domain-containing protein [Neorhodopirellula pilleata]|uniref:FG-GAP repeat protein n=1 Tax=Neorhodopirellula pilleata TaxID=2714738 RepID=A0A5C6AVW4_9BACT|nr:FG-GAP and VCBS repeat-containing protein [Neorhodopirellula pilleata]TWU03900.1 FG-GAP repeat protein [Neorhodopirellula pilleata]